MYNNNKSDIIYINIYTKINNPNYSLALINQIGNQDTQSDSINIYLYDDSDENIRSYVQQYNIYINDYLSNAVCIAQSKYNTYLDSLSLSTNYHRYVFLLDTEIIIPKNLSSSIVNFSKNSDEFYIANNAKILGLSCGKNFIYDLIRDKVPIIDIKNRIKNKSSNYPTLSASIIPLMPSDNGKLTNKLVISNEYFVFFEVKNGAPSNLSDTYIYANRRNNKAYDINNNLIGYVVSDDTSSINILWPNIDHPQTYLLS